MDDMDEQSVQARGGFAYGVKHGDLHVHGSGGVSYRLERVEDPLPGDPVPHRWPEGRLSALWLHGPDFTRTGAASASIAAGFAADGWAVLAARPSNAPGTDPVPADATGVVIIVAGADDWSTPELGWLLSNTVLHRPELPARLLLTASSMNGLPALRAALTPLRAGIHPIEIARPSGGTVPADRPGDVPRGTTDVT
ncbi:hypothetical protein Ait01nite_058250 [Actinoplanes italicus]|uniref:Uncharacterized protein n=2 Tax=Actinoplanes italicus TaxID=113567 RepID=A0A2T0K5W3_9ACTN|nr:hypothetical protein CLV67_113205 [Actinoplanes italicus]GIE32780.1 hypothetical protein Ait01nite_058250 [Actinoplanes italicus]